MFRFLVLLSVWALVHSDELNSFDTERIIRQHDYPAETHHVITDDGYILEMHRIPHGKGQSYSPDRPVVFMMHGLLAASNCYIALGPQYGPAYNLADAGFDVWMGNARGNRNSRQHISLNPSGLFQKRNFWDFSWEEIALIDVPAMIEYALASTNKQKLHYLGHSQGGTVFLVLNSMKPEFQNKIETAHLWAGVGYMNHFPHTLLKTSAQLTDSIYNSAVIAGQVELFGPGSIISSGRQADNCFGDPELKHICNVMGISALLAEETESRDTSDDSFSLLVAGAALKQVAHYGQNIRDKTFARWNHGTIQNRIKYGTRNPPTYDLSLITIDVTMHYTVNDGLLDERDVLAMASVMPNTTARKVTRDSFTHLDFVTSSDTKELVTDYVIRDLKRVSGL